MMGDYSARFGRMSPFGRVAARGNKAASPQPPAPASAGAPGAVGMTPPPTSSAAMANLPAQAPAYGARARFGGTGEETQAHVRDRALLDAQGGVSPPGQPPPTASGAGWGGDGGGVVQALIQQMMQQRNQALGPLRGIM